MLKIAIKDKYIQWWLQCQSTSRSPTWWLPWLFRYVWEYKSVFF